MAPRCSLLARRSGVPVTFLPAHIRPLFCEDACTGTMESSGVRCYPVIDHLLCSCCGGGHEIWLLLLIIIMMVIFKCYFSGEFIALSFFRNNGVTIELGKTNRLEALCIMQINT